MMPLILWRMSLDLVLDDRACKRLEMSLGLHFHGGNALGEITLAHRFLRDDLSGSTVLRLVRLSSGLAIEVAAFGDGGAYPQDEFQGLIEQVSRELGGLRDEPPSAASGSESHYWRPEKVGAVAERIEVEAGQVVMPFYIMCDVSTSMARDMAALDGTLRRLQREVVEQPVVDDIARFSVLTFSDSAKVATPLGHFSEAALPSLSVEGGTNYGSAFRLLAQTLDADRQRLRSAGYLSYRPCAFFLTDGQPSDRDWKDTFRRTLTYDRSTGRGNRSHPVFVPLGIRDAPVDVMRQLAYPPGRSRWYVAKGSNVQEAIHDLFGVITSTVVASSQAVGGRAALALALPPPGSDVVSGDSSFDTM